MEWLKEILLAGKISETDVGSVVDAINKMLPQHFIPKSKYNSTSEELKATKEEMLKLQGQVGELGKVQGVSEELQKKLQETSTAFETFKTDTEKREKLREKSGIIEKHLKTANASEDAIDLLLNEFNLVEINIDSKGNIVDWEDKLNTVKEKRKSLFAVVDNQTGKPPAGQSGQPAKPVNEMNMEEYAEQWKKQNQK